MRTRFGYGSRPACDSSPPSPSTPALRAGRRRCSSTFAERGSAAISAVLAQHDINAPAGSFYAYEASRRLGLPEGGGVRIGLAPYNTAADVDRLVDVLATTLHQPPLTGAPNEQAPSRFGLVTTDH